MTVEPQLGVLVPAIMGVGLLVTLAGDAVHRVRRTHRFEQRQALEGQLTAAWVRSPHEARHASIGVRSRWFYLLLGLASLTLGGYLTLGAWANFLGFTWWSENISWIVLVLQLVACGFIALGVIAWTVAWRHDNPPAWTRPVIARSILGRQPPESPQAGPEPSPQLRLLGTQHISDRIAHTARVVAVVWSLAAMTAFIYLAEQDRIPQADGGTTLERTLAQPVQIGLLALIGVGLVIAWKWEAVGAAVMALGGAMLGVVAVVQYPPHVALGVAFVFLVPAFLHWLAWQRDRGITRIGGLFAITVVLVLAVGVVAARGYDRFFGPTHPLSATQPPAASAVEWVWAGGTSDTGTQIVAKLDDDTEQARIVVSSEEKRTKQLYVSQWQPVSDDSHYVVRASFDDLEPDTDYSYVVETETGVAASQRGRLRTFPAGPADFTVALAACASTGSEGTVFDTIRDHQPLLYLQTGDLHYANIETNNQDLFRGALNVTLTSPPQGALYRSTSTAYVWDDHDYSGNDANRTADSKPAAQAVYRQYVPHHALAGTPDAGPIYQSFTVGRVRFVLTDTRSTRTPQEATDDQNKYMLDPEQEDWFVDQLKAAKKAGEVVAWVNSVPWIAEPQEGADNWAGYTTQRSRLAETVNDLGMNDQVVMLAGDAHMVAIDDGSNTNYSDTPGRGFPLLHAGALDRIGSVKGGPYSGGTFPGGGQFGLLEVEDSGGPTVTVTLTGKTWEDSTLVEQAFRLTPSG